MITKAAFKTELKSLGIKTYRTQNGKTFIRRQDLQTALVIAALKYVVASRKEPLEVDDWIEATQSKEEWADDLDIEVDMVYEQYDEWRKGIIYGDEPKFLYRAVCLNDLKELKKKKLGIHWSYSERGADCYQTDEVKGPNKYIFQNG